MATLEGGKRTPVRKVPRTPVTEHEGRVSQPSVPAGPRNSAGGEKTVVTVSSTGHVSAVGPEARDAAAEARKSLVRVRAKNAKTKVTKAGVEVNPAKGTPAIDKVPAAIKSVVKTLERQDPTSAPIRSAVESEAKNVVKVAKQSVTPGREARGIVKLPSSSEARAAAAITAPVAGDARIVEEAADVGKGAVAKAAAKGAEETARKAEDIRTAPQRAVQAVKDAPTKAKEFPGRVKELPKDVREALETPDARRAAAKSAGKTAAKHPIKVGVPAAAILPPGAIPGGVPDRARALLTGLYQAVQHPGDMATATLHASLGAFTAPLAVSASAVESAKQGNIGPLTDELGTLAGGIEDIGKKLVSGDPHEVEQTFRHEIGATPFIPVPHVLKSVKNSDEVTGLVGDLRGKVEDKRAVKRNRLIEDAKAAEDEGAYVSHKHAKKIKAPIEDTRTGQPYINRPLGKFIEHQKGRHEVSRIVSRIEQSGNHAAKAASQDIIKELRKSKLATRSDMNIGDVQRLFNKYGLPLNKDGGEAFTRMLHKNWPKAESGAVPAGEIVDRHATKWLLDHPEAFDDPHLAKAVKDFDKKAEQVGTSPVNQHRATVENIINPLREAEGKHRLPAPEEMVPKQTEDLMGTLVKGPLKEPWTRKTVLDYAKELHGPEGDALRKQIEATLVDENGKKLMLPPEHGGPAHGVSTTQSVRWTPEMAKTYVDAAHKEESGRGLRAPAAYVADRLPDPLKEKLPNFKSQLPTAKEWASQGKAAKSGNALSDFENFIQNSVEAPRHKAAMAKGVGVLIDKASRQVEGKRAFTDDEARRLINQHKVPDDTVWARPGIFKAVLSKDHSISPEEIRGVFEAEMDNGARIANGEKPTPIDELPVSDQLKSDLAEVEHLPGEKLAPVDGSYMREFLDHMKPLGGLNTFLGNSTRYASRAILNSPAFEAIQFAQEGIPAAAALARNVVHLPEAYKAMKVAAKGVEEGKITPEEVADWKAVASSSAGLMGTPTRRAMSAEGYLDPIRLAAKPEVWRKAWNLVNGKYLSEFDLHRAGVMREMGLSAKEIGDFKKASKGFNVWRRSANNLYKDMGKAVEDMKDMDVNERHAYMAHHPELEDRFHKAAHGMMGNWDSFTKFEKSVSPLTMFYSFQRYSALWFLWQFPLDHPIAATALTMLGAVNSKELQKIAAEHGNVPAPLDYTMPVYSKGAGKEPGIGTYGKRTFPGLSTPAQAAVTGKPSQLLGEAPPYLSIPVEAALGKSSYTGQELGENGWAYIGRSVAELNPGMRLFLGLTGEESTAAKTFHAQDPLAKWRSFADPYIGQTAEQYGKTKELEKNFDLKYGEGHQPGPYDSKLFDEIMFGGKNGGIKSPAEQRAAIKKVHESEEGSAGVKAAEKPFLPGDKGLSPEQEEFQQGWEDAYQTGPSESEEGSGNSFSEAVQASKGETAKNSFSQALSQTAGGPTTNSFSQALSEAR
jgi:hypothetical protein